MTDRGKKQLENGMASQTIYYKTIIKTNLCPNL